MLEPDDDPASAGAGLAGAGDETAGAAEACGRGDDAAGGALPPPSVANR